jgi:hypothetical protein
MSEHHDPDIADAGSDEGWHPSTEQLQRHLDDSLPLAESTRIADHLDGCARCVAALDSLEPPPALEPSDDLDLPAFDERRMRRAVRRTLLRTAFNAAVLLLVGGIALQLLGALVVNPVFVARGDRVTASLVASIDLPIMTNPGSEVVEVTSNAGVLRRTTEIDVERPVGAQMSRLGDYTTRIGPIGMSSPGSSTIVGSGPRLSEQPGDRSAVEFEPDRLGEGTAVTVQLIWDRTLELDEANTVTDAADDLALLWVGFQTPGATPRARGGHLGYGACHDIPAFIQEAQSGSFGTSGSFRTFPPTRGNGAQHALDQLRRATTNLAATGWLENEPVEGGALADIAATATWLQDNDPGVTSVVITGPTQAVAAAADASAADQTALLEVDFDRGAPQDCG